jgi:hypothetical protein
MSETSVHRRRVVTRKALAALAIAAAAATLLSGCSPGADYPSIFPAIHDMPPPRADTPLDPIQVQQATEDLITARNHLNAEAPPGAGQAKTPAADAKETAAQKKSPPASASSAAAGGAQAGAAGTPQASAGSTQTAGADAKP